MDSDKISADEFLKVSQKILLELFPERRISKSFKISDKLDHDLALDSLARVEFLSRIEKHFNVTFSERDFIEMEALGDVLLALLKSKDYTDASIKKEFERVEELPTELTPSNLSTLIEVLDWHVKNHPERVHVEFYTDVGGGPNHTYRELRERAEAIAAGLQDLGVKRNDKIILMLPTGEEYLQSFFGVLLAGGTPVPIYPLGRPDQLEDHIRRHQYILSNCNASVIIAPSEIKPIARLLKVQVKSLKDIVSVVELSKTSKIFIPQEIHSTSLALIQYTSGSTGNPKGVMLTHANLLSNIRAIGEVLRVTPKDVVVSWLPLYHDMGLIGAWLGSLYYSARLILLSPLSFLTRPERWPWAIHRHQATISAGPNFAYQLCLHRIKEEDLTGLDLSSIRVFLNGAEKVDPDTVEHFAQRFQKYRLKKEALMPVYGLAESSVALCFPPLDRGPTIEYIDRKQFMEKGKAIHVSTSDPLALRFVGCGVPLPGHQIRVVDSFQHEMSESIEGEIQFRGPSATSGYYENIEQTKKLFINSWLTTGDRGYISNGELFVTGRIKDIIIRGGRHIYPEEIENAVGEISGIRKGRVVAFGGFDSRTGTEKLVVVAETQEVKPEILNDLKRNISKVTSDFVDAPPEDVVLALPGSILKTSSGKLRRSATRELYEHDQLGLPPRAIWRQVTVLVLQGAFNQIRFFLGAVMSQLYALYCWVIFLCLAPIAWLLVMIIPRLEWRWRILHGLLKMFFKIIAVPIHVTGDSDNLSTDTPRVFVANHSSYLDSLVLVAVIPQPICFIAKKELSKIFLLSLALKRIGTQFIDRFSIEKSLEDTRNIERSLGNNKSLLFFPEGTFVRASGLLPFHSGAFFMAAKNDRPVTPLSIQGTRNLLHSDSWFPRHGSIAVFIGEAITSAQVPQELTSDVWLKANFIQNYTRNFILQHNQEPDQTGGCNKEGSDVR